MMILRIAVGVGMVLVVGCSDDATTRPDARPGDRGPLADSSQLADGPAADRGPARDGPQQLDRPAALPDQPAPAGDQPKPVADKPAVVPDKPPVVPDKPAVVPDKPPVVPDKPPVVPDKPPVVPDKPPLPGCAPGYAGCTSYTDGTAGSQTVSFGGNLGFAYAPKCLRIKAGQSVTFAGDFGVHPLAQAPCGPASVITNGSGTSITFTFTVAGRYGYYCTAHSDPQGNGMAGVIEVLP